MQVRYRSGIPGTGELRDRIAIRLCRKNNEIGVQYYGMLSPLHQGAGTNFFESRPCGEYPLVQTGPV